MDRHQRRFRRRRCRLDGTAGNTVEASCERALFASPEATAAAVAYVAAQLSLLADGSDYEHRSGMSYESALAGLRLAIETDRFGIVAHILAVRNGCTSDRCDLLALLRNGNRVSDNLIGRRYEFFVGRHSAEWPLAGLTPVAANAAVSASPTPAPKPAPIARTTPNNLFFPSSASIPAVSIMAPEPSGPPQSGTPADAAAKPPAPPRKPAPATQQTRRPTAPTAPTLLAPAPAPVLAPVLGQAGGG